jgi:hypothetical protein
VRENKGTCRSGAERDRVIEIRGGKIEAGKGEEASDCHRNVDSQKHAMSYQW